MNKISPFTQRQYEYYKRTFGSWLNVCEGGKRGGKNVLQTFPFCERLEYHKNKLHIVAGVSISTARLNVLDCDGFGMLNYFEGRCREGKYKGRECLYIQTATGEKVVLVSGGGKSGDEKLIKGNSPGMVLITEANECHQNFIKEAFDRTIASTDRAIFLDLNPKNPKHWFYTEVLDFHKEKQETNPAYGYNFGHFTILDNMSVSDDELKRNINTYDKGSIWYRRDILGERLAADGLIYKMFADDTEAFLLNEPPKDIITVNIGVDFGGSGSASAFVAVGYTRGFKQVVVLAEEHRPAATENPETLSKAFVEFVRRVQLTHPTAHTCYADSAEQILIRGLRVEAVRAKLSIGIRNALKGEIINRIRLVNALMATGRFKVMRSCKKVISALQTAVYDSKAVDDVRLDDGTSDIDTIDALEYCIEPFERELQITAGINQSKTLPSTKGAII